MKLGTWCEGQGKGRAGPRTVVVLLHGIFSDHNTFSEMREGLQDRLADHDGAWRIIYCDYDYNKDLQRNGLALDEEVTRATSPDDRVVLVCHSMGGLVARVALLVGGDLATRVKRVILLGTPNHGALSTAQLALLAQLLISTGGGLFGIFHRRQQGIRQLTDVDRLMKQLISTGASRVANIEYVTIPGTFFHQGRRAWEIGEWGEDGVWKLAFAGLSISFEVVRGLSPLLGAEIRRPHDGIVEASSNSLVPSGPGRWSEKTAAINHAGHSANATYAHLETGAGDELTHVMIQRDKRMIALVADLVVATSLATWYRGLTGSALAELNATIPGVT